MSDFYREGDVVFGSWMLGKKIGEGSFGQVYEASRTDFGEIYKTAVKIITIPQSESEIKSARAEGMDDLSITKYFRSLVEEIVQEFALMARLKGNSHIVSYEDHMVTERRDGIGWHILIRMELLTPLLDYIQRQPLTRTDVIKLGIDITKALELCQRYNIVHRDIKPENIFVSDAGDFKLGDFGIARTVEKTTGGLSKKGTYTYMAPEVYKDEPYGSSVDIYSLGLVMYRLLNENRAPFLPAYPAPITHSDRENALAQRVSGAMLPPPKNADGRLAEIVLKACAYQPKDRYSSPMQMREELEAIQYSRSEARVIYPAGDEAPIRSERNVPTDATEGIFHQPGVTSQYDKTTSSPQVEKTVFDKTQSAFGGGRPISPPNPAPQAPAFVPGQKPAGRAQAPNQNTDRPQPASPTAPVTPGAGPNEKPAGKTEKKKWQMPPAVGACLVCFWSAMTLFYDAILWGNLQLSTEPKAFTWTCCILTAVLVVAGLVLLFIFKHEVSMLLLLIGSILGPGFISNNYMYTALGREAGSAMGMWLWVHIIGGFFVIGPSVSAYLANKPNAKYVKSQKKK